jgi:hypothetical protein
MYLTPNNGESHKPQHFREKILSVSWARKILICTFKFPFIFETLPDRKFLCTYLNSAQKVLLSSPFEVRGKIKS